MDQYMEFLRKALPLADRMTWNEEDLRQVCAHALSVREKSGWDVPDDIFLPFVLFPRVNNEDLVHYQEPICAALRERIRGMDMAGAILEVNRWCFEMATYASTDNRTANPLTVIRRGFGRCGEESVLLTSALRSCGIPARQVYVPFWSHCDDNHAWVEAWADGTWHYLGACEPELTLDSGWFTAAASKAMLVHTRAYGILPRGERSECREGGAYVLNRTAAYAETRLATVHVTRHGACAPGARIVFEVANMGAFRPICRKETDSEGKADILTGLGTLHVHATDGEHYVMGTLEGTVNELHLDLEDAPRHDFLFTQHPPMETRLQPTGFPEDVIGAHEAWMAQAEKARQAKFAVEQGTDPLIASARGNRDVIARFLDGDRDKRALLESLREKDLVDVTEDVLYDALETALPFKDRYPYEVWAESVLCPRVAQEMLRPVRTSLPKMTDARAVWAYVSSFECSDMQPKAAVPDLAAVCRERVCSDFVRDILFVAICRASGIAARLDPVTGEKTVWESGYRPFLPGREKDALLVLENRTQQTLSGDVHYSVSVLEEGGFRPLDLTDSIPEGGCLRVPVHAGTYRVMTCLRCSDGSVSGTCREVIVQPGASQTVPLVFPDSGNHPEALRVPLPSLGGALPQGQSAIVAVLAPRQEPTEHFLNELLEAGDELSGSGIAVRLIVQKEKDLDNEKVLQAAREIRDTKVLTGVDQEVLVRWRELLHAGEMRLPLAVAVDREGRGLFAFTNYHVGSVRELIRIIREEEKGQNG